MNVVLDLHNQGTPCLEIADRLGIKRNKVYLMLRSLGVQPIPLPEWLCRKRLHDMRVTGRFSGKHCLACRKESWSRYNRARRSKP